MRIERIETERLYIRGFEKTDVSFAMSIWNDPIMGQYLVDPTIDQIDEKYIKSVEGLPEDEECCSLIAESKVNGERIGTCSFVPSEDGTAYDIGYCIHKDFWRQGYGTEMVSGMMAYAKSHGCKKITVYIFEDNVASNHLIQKLGYKIVGQKTCKKGGSDIEHKDNIYELEI